MLLSIMPILIYVCESIISASAKQCFVSKKSVSARVMCWRWLREVNICSSSILFSISRMCVCRRCVGAVGVYLWCGICVQEIAGFRHPDIPCQTSHHCSEMRSLIRGDFATGPELTHDLLDEPVAQPRASSYM